MLRKFDPDLVAKLVVASEKEGITLALNGTPRKIIRNEKGFTVIADNEKGKKAYVADMVVHGAGRVPDIDDLNLEAAGIKRSPDGIMVNTHLQIISNDCVYSAGDVVAGGIPLTPVAMR